LRLVSNRRRRATAAGKPTVADDALLTSAKISFFGNFGSANTGNESVLLAIISRLQMLYPAGDFRCICSNPEAVTTRYGIQAVAFSTNGAKLWDRDVSVIRRLPMGFAALVAELGQFFRAFRILRGTDMLIVPGTGLLTDAHGIYGWGPYSLSRWALMAKLRHARVLFICVGAGPITSRAGGRLLRMSLSLASYRSYRDETSRECLRSVGVHTKRDLIYPDLAFSLPEAILPGDRSPLRDAKRVVGLGLMAYSPEHSGLGRGPDTYQNYLEALALFAEWLFDHGYEIRLLLGDDDTEAIDDFRSVLEAQLDGSYEDRLVEQPFGSVQDVLDAVAATDVVVATRFHNVLLSLVLNKPVIAISFHHKCSSLMRQMKLSAYCHEIHEMDAARLIEQFQLLEQDEDAIRSTIADGVSRARAALDEQYDRLFAPA
jgi:polysaccharide pyruvyl transferase WcaK-like protein